MTFLFDVDDFAMRREFAVAARQATARERREPEQANETHHGDPPDVPTRSNFCTAEVAKLVIWDAEEFDDLRINRVQTLGLC